MNPVYVEAVQNKSAWQSVFAFQVFHRPTDEWIKMKWGFNSGALLDEAFDRFKFFLESQTTSDEFQSEDDENTHTLALRCINLPGIGVQAAILGRVIGENREQSILAGQAYAREIFSTFPYDFVLEPAVSHADLERLTGAELFGNATNVTFIQRDKAFIPPMLRHQYMPGLWQTSPRAIDQVWRAMFALPKKAMLNVTLRPSTLYENERQLLLDVKKKLPEAAREEGLFSPHIEWVNAYIKRRLAPWRKLFQMQVHVLAADEPDESLLRSIGSAFTRNSNETPTPGFQVTYPNDEKEQALWAEQVRLLDFIPQPRRMDDVADIDEVFSVFRLPYRQEAGLPGVGLIERQSDSPDSAEQKRE